MRALFATAAALVIVTGSALAKEPARRTLDPMPMPSIMVEDPAPASRKARPATSRRKSTPQELRQAEIRRAALLRRARLIVQGGPRSGETELGAINRSIDVQQQQMRFEQQNQFENNQLRQNLQRNSIGSGGGYPLCPVGSIAC